MLYFRSSSSSLVLHPVPPSVTPRILTNHETIILFFLFFFLLLYIDITPKHFVLTVSFLVFVFWRSKSYDSFRNFAYADSSNFARLTKKHVEPSGRSAYIILLLLFFLCFLRITRWRFTNECTNVRYTH